MPESTFDTAAAHRWFAIEFNNRAWDLVEAASRTDDETDEMLHTAHAAWVHWRAAGDELNRLRAECLLATAYVKAGSAESAVRYGRSCVRLSEQVGAEQTPFDRASVHGCLAAALSLAGERSSATEQEALAIAAAAQLTEEGDREVFEQLYGASTGD